MGGMSIEWIYPSWRDLLIENLIAHPLERRAFLHRCAVPGILLALSRAGGSVGRRELPLLIDAEDWNLVAAAICRNLPTASAWEVRQIFTVVIDAIKHAGSKGDQDAEHLTSLANACLTTCREMWNQNGYVISYQNLHAYYQLTMLVHPLMPGPQLELTWAASWNRVKSAIRDSTTEGDDLPAALESAIGLALLIVKNEPRFLVQFGYPAEYLDSAARFLEYAVEDLRAEPSLSSESDFDDRDFHLNDMTRLIGLVAKEFTSLRNQATELVGGFEAKSKSVQAKKYEKFPDSPNDEGASAPSEPSEFDLIAVFKDL